MILLGDPRSVSAVAKSSPHKHKINSGTLCFSETLDSKQMMEIIRSFENHHMPIDKSRYEICWILHEDKSSPDLNRRTELNFVVVQRDLKTGKHLNFFGGNGNLRGNDWRCHSDPWRDAINIEYGLSRPDQIKNISTDINFEKHLSEKTGKAELIKIINDYVITRVDHIFCRDDVVDIINENLREFGIKVESAHNDRFISISSELFKKNIRLKGGIYDQSNYDNRGFKHLDTREEIKRYVGSPDEYRTRCEQADIQLRNRADEYSKRTGIDSKIGNSNFKESVFQSLVSSKVKTDGTTDQKEEQRNREIKDASHRTKKDTKPINMVLPTVQTETESSESSIHEINSTEEKLLENVSSVKIIKENSNEQLELHKQFIASFDNRSEAIRFIKSTTEYANSRGIGAKRGVTRDAGIYHHLTANDEVLRRRIKTFDAFISGIRTTTERLNRNVIDKSRAAYEFSKNVLSHDETIRTDIQYLGDFAKQFKHAYKSIESNLEGLIRRIERRILRGANLTANSHESMVDAAEEILEKGPKNLTRYISKLAKRLSTNPKQLCKDHPKRVLLIAGRFSHEANWPEYVRKEIEQRMIDRNRELSHKSPSPIKEIDLKIPIR